MSFPINTGIPDAPNDPADDQPLMKGNFSNINSYLQIDHVTAGAPGNGFHKQVTFFSENVPIGSPTDPTSILFTAPGIASTIAQLEYQNQNLVLPLSVMKAWALANVGGIVAAQSFNVASIVKPPLTTGIYNVTLSANSVTGTNFSVFVTPMSAPSIIIWTISITGALTFTITFFRIITGGTFAAIDPTSFSFQVLQI